MNELGIHARSAACIANLAKNALENVWVIKEGERADAASIIDVLSLACVQGTEILLQVDDISDINILNEISELIEAGFGE
ncbi:MAG: HPr family phosphocarrier protein [Desulfobacterales bacterium]|nr:HPr family phosphocarrier protein [Desulfobacteraceae bacterium]MBT7085033.1 HPr family phosphocarrier protein [Desulfobacterales bacterium]MBT7696762.1 HPr family phosphocarrier protein [Desulfobacterales bacterium]